MIPRSQRLQNRENRRIVKRITDEGQASDLAFIQLYFFNGDIRDLRECDTFRGKQAVLFINQLGKRLTQKISGDRGSESWAPGHHRLSLSLSKVSVKIS